MTACQNKASASYNNAFGSKNILGNAPGNAPGNALISGLRKLVIVAGLGLGLSIGLGMSFSLGMSSAFAGPVDLLKLTPPDAPAPKGQTAEAQNNVPDNASTTRLQSINKMFAQTLKGDDATAAIKDQPPGNSPTGGAPIGDAPISASTGAPTGASTEASNIYGSARIGRRNISDVGLAAIGVGDLGKNNLDTMIWRGTSARDAVFLLEKTAVDSASKALTDLAYQVVARQSVPASGANLVAAELVLARLDFLANGGRSSDLAVLAAQLPEAKKWANWRRWLVEHHLMMRDDFAACSVVGQQITQTMDPFWHRANIICQAVQGNLGGARFAADILAANGNDDTIFFNLVDEILDGAAAKPVDTTQLNSMHIVLMDVANRLIPLEGLSVLPKQMAETIVKLKFLGPDARMVSTFDALSRGLITHRQAGKLWRNAGTSKDDPQLALARLQEANSTDGSSALTTALAWRALDVDMSDKRLTRVAGAIKAEIVAGQGALMLPLYAELVRNALSDETIAANMRFDDLGIAPKMAFLLAINQPDDTTSLEAFAGNADALLAAELLRNLDGGTVGSSVIGGLNMWHMLAVFDAAGMVIEDQNWLDLTKVTARLERSVITLPSVLMQAMIAASEDRRVAETVLLANWLLQDVQLAKVNAADAAVLIKALQTIGQTDTANALAGEFIAAHLMQQLALMIPDDPQS